MKLIILAIILISCSSLMKDNRSQSHYVYGPLPENANLKEAQSNLTRKLFREEIGEVRAHLITPAYIYLLKSEARKNKTISKKESLFQINNDINHFVRYQTCFTLDVYSHHPDLIDLKWWKAYISYGDDLILPAKVTDLTEEMVGKVIDSNSFNEYKGFGTICTSDRMNLNDEFTLVLQPKARPGLKELRLTWLKVVN